MIHFYYYEKYMSKIIFDDNYYLINPEWLEKYKKIYSYDNIFNLLKEFDKNNKIVNYYNIDNYINIITDKYKDNFIGLKIQLNTPEYLKKLNYINAPIMDNHNLKYFYNCHILPEKIIDKIMRLEFNMKASSLIKSHKIITKNGNIFIRFNINTINIGI